MEQATVVYVVEMTERERGWGQRPDGFFAFPTEEKAKAYVNNQTKDRTGPAPDEYVSYDLIGYRECSQAFLDKLAEGRHSRVYFDRLGELKG